MSTRMKVQNTTEYFEDLYKKFSIINEGTSTKSPRAPEVTFNYQAQRQKVSCEDNATVQNGICFTFHFIHFIIKMFVKLISNNTQESIYPENMLFG